MFRFFIALWISKFLMNFRKLANSDFPGKAACKICPKFLKLISRPKLTICVTGTNGKSVTSGLVSDFLSSSGMSVSYNERGWNLRSGFAVNLINGVSLLNKPKVDCVVLESDELIMDTDLVALKPDYILVTNIAKDDLQRNGHPENTFHHIEKAFRLLGEGTTAILNANDPISSRLDEGGRRIYFAMSDTRSKAYVGKNGDLTHCPICGAPLRYDFVHYRNIGKYMCSGCDFKTPHAEYTAEFVDFDTRTMVINGFRYSLISGSLYNAFNVLSVIALFRDMGYREEEIAAFLEKGGVSEQTETRTVYGGKEIGLFNVDTGNSSAASTIFESLVKDHAFKDVILFMDRPVGTDPASENIAWMYDTDFEILNNANIHNIIFAGPRRNEMKIRLLMAGVPEERMTVFSSEDDLQGYRPSASVEKICIIYDRTRADEARGIRNNITALLKEGR